MRDAEPERNRLTWGDRERSLGEVPKKSCVVRIVAVVSPCPDLLRNSTPGYPYVWHGAALVLRSANPSSP